MVCFGSRVFSDKFISCYFPIFKFSNDLVVRYLSSQLESCSFRANSCQEDYQIYPNCVFYKFNNCCRSHHPIHKLSFCNDSKHSGPNLFLYSVVYSEEEIFPAMHSRGRFALQNIDTEKRKRIESRKQEILLKLYKYVIVFSMITFEMRILKDLVFYNGYIILESICMNPCWFAVTYQLPVFKLFAPTVSIQSYISLGFLVAVKFINIIVFFNFTVMNATINCVASWPRLRQQFAMRNKSYRFHQKRY